ncbi:MAG: hypothetical protein AB7N80_08450 [Bdellovibrionales bacterium]
MNVKSLTPNLSALDPRLRTEAKDNVRLQNSGDRDADGRRQQNEPEHKRHLNESEFETALETLKKNAAVTAHNLQIRVEQHEDHRVIFIEDRAGQVIRRLSEADLWLVTRENDRPTGKILDKAG